MCAHFRFFIGLALLVMPSNVVSGPLARLEEPNELVQIRSYEAHDVVKPVNKEDACGVFQPQSQPGNVQSPEA